MDLESEENVEKDEFFEECLSDPTLRDQMSILTRKFKNKMQVKWNRSQKQLVTIDHFYGQDLSYAWRL